VSVVGRRSRGRLAGLLLASVALATTVALADEERWTLAGMIDPTLWKTDEGSRLLARNDGDPSADGSLRVWFAAEVTDGLQAVVLGELYGASNENGVSTELEQAVLRYSFRTRKPLFVEAGSFVTPLGNFSGRYLPTVNPLIGRPTSYGVSYPLGVQVAGSRSRVDFRVAVVDLPLVNERYLPEAGSAPRPAVAVGVTPATGARIGAYFTQGPYLSDAVEPFLPAGAGWKDFSQRIVGLDLQFSRGHLELNGDWAQSSYDVPTRSDAHRGRAWFAEAKYTFTPRMFAALRVEENLYLFSRPLAPGTWIASLPTVRDVEVGAGYRLDRLTLVKASVRADRWSVDPAVAADFPNGYAAAVQLVYRFDVRSWFEGSNPR